MYNRSSIPFQLESQSEISHKFGYKSSYLRCMTLAWYHQRSGLSGGAISVLAASYNAANDAEFIKAVASKSIAVTPTANDISHYENGGKNPTALTRAKLAYAFSVIEGRTITEAELFPEYLIDDDGK